VAFHAVAGSIWSRKLHIGRTVISPRLAAAAPIAVTAGICLLLSACSPGVDYPSLFPAVHDVPPPRADAPLDPNQVQQATEDLISARDRLSAEVQSKNSAKPAATPVATASARKPPAASPTVATTGSRQLTGSEAAQQPAAETK
jgi:hypothetical protein